MLISPSFLLFLFAVLIYSSTLLLAISISQYVWQSEQQRGRSQRPSLLWYLFGIPGALLFLGWIFFRTSYYDYFVLTMGTFSLFAVWFTALMLAALPRLIFQTEGCLLRVAVLAGGLFCAYLCITQPPALATQTMAVLGGPQLDHGGVEETHTGGGRTPIHYATINGVEYEVPDGLWFRTLRRGQDVPFVHDPSHTVAFGPMQPGLTTRGMLFLIIAVILWLFTFIYIVRGLLVLGEHIARRLNPKDQHTARI